MRDYGKVYSSIWSSADFRALSEDGRSLVLYLLTSHHGTIAGVFRLPDGYACEDTQWSPERLAEAFAQLLSKGFANRCETTKWVWVSKFLEWNPPENPNQRKAAAKMAGHVPDSCSWKSEFMRVCGPSLGIEPTNDTKGSRTVDEPLLNQEQEQKQKQKKPTRGARKTSLPADFGISERVRLWATEKGHRHLDEQLEALVSHAKRNGATYIDWDEALMNAVRGDWAKVKSKANGVPAADLDELFRRGQS